MASVEEMLSNAFQCQKCLHKGAHVQQVAMSGTGISRLLEIQPYSYALVSCDHCGYTEMFDLSVLEGKDNLGTFLDTLFMD